jgi:hypothetical protein
MQPARATHVPYCCGLQAYSQVFGRVNVQSAECDLIPQTRRHTLFEQLLYFAVVSIPCCPKVDHGKNDVS